MKKIKIMLTSLALLAVVGGALAFKAKYSVEYCTGTPTNGICRAETPEPIRTNCTLLTTNQTTVGGEGAFVCTTTPNAQGACTNLLCTTTSTTLIADGD